LAFPLKIELIEHEYRDRPILALIEALESEGLVAGRVNHFPDIEFLLPAGNNSILSSFTSADVSRT